VFVKHPAPGAVKTRLAAAVGPEAAARLYRSLAERVLEATTPRAGEYERLVFFHPREALAAMRAWLPGARLVAQGAGDLGARMSDAVARAFARGAGRVALVGSDAPGVSRETVVAALDALDAADVVIGPAEDGGYYLVALRAPRPELFAGVAWSTPSVRAQTLTQAAAAGLSVRELAPLRDVDTLQDLRALGMPDPVLGPRRSPLRSCPASLRAPPFGVRSSPQHQPCAESHLLSRGEGLESQARVGDRPGMRRLACSDRSLPRSLSPWSCPSASPRRNE
jgi:rSAM/selenodomain-associated transferase 1